MLVSFIKEGIWLILNTNIRYTTARSWLKPFQSGEHFDIFKNATQYISNIKIL